MGVCFFSFFKKNNPTGSLPWRTHFTGPWPVVQPAEKQFHCVKPCIKSTPVALLLNGIFACVSRYWNANSYFVNKFSFDINKFPCFAVLMGLRRANTLIWFSFLSSQFVCVLSPPQSLLSSLVEDSITWDSKFSFKKSNLVWLFRNMRKPAL